jgi:hypothetical protein
MARYQDFDRRNDDRFGNREDDERRRQEGFGSEGRGDYGRGGNFERNRESWRGQGRSTHEESDRGGHERYGRDFGRSYDEFGRERGERGHRAEHGRHEDYGSREREHGGWGAGAGAGQEDWRSREGGWGREGTSRPWGESGRGRTWSDEGSFSSSSESERPWGQQGSMGWGPGSTGNPPGMTYGGTYGGTSQYGGLTGMGYYGTSRDPGMRGGQSMGRYGSSDFGSRGREYGRNDERSGGEHEGFFEKVGRFFGKGPKNYKRSDGRIEEEVNEMLFRDPHVDATDIEVEVSEGEVTLSGTVEDRNTKRMAEDCVWNVSGVRNVTNLIRVEQREYLRDDEWGSRRRSGMSSTPGTTSSSLGGATTGGSEETRNKRQTGTTSPAQPGPTGSPKVGTGNNAQ